MQQDKLYIITYKKKGYIGHPNWRVTKEIRSATIFAELDMAQKVAKKVDGTVVELIVGDIVPEKGE